MEHVAQYLLATHSERKSQAESLDALMRAMVQLPSYLERVLAGGRDLALVLLPLRSEEHTSELQSPCNLVCRLLLEKKKNKHVVHLAYQPDVGLAHHRGAAERLVERLPSGSIHASLQATHLAIARVRYSHEESLAGC